MTQMAKLKILVVDDDETMLQAIWMWLYSAGHEVVTRSTPFGTSQQILRMEPDVVMLDLDMPGLRGETLAEMIRGKQRATSVIFYSGKEPAELQDLARTYGALGAIHKSVHGDDFVRLFQKLTSRLGAI